MKLGLGTVQFGLDYGVANHGGRPGRAEVDAILAQAATFGVRLLDTAAQYGESEAVLGASAQARSFAIVTKTPPLNGDGDVAAQLGDTFRRSLQRLGRSAVHGLLVHRVADLLSPAGDAIWTAMERLRDEGLVARIGFSAYTAAQIDAVLARYPVDLVQVPVNLLDQRLIRSGRLAMLKARGVEIHARSPFLQGLLLMDPAQLPGHFTPWQARLAALRAAIDQRGLTPLAAALGFVAAQDSIDVVLCGVDSAPQFAQVAAAYRQALAAEDVAGLDRFAVEDEDLLNPARWRTE